ncbi:MAG: glycoside hydrolase [Treponema sp.]|nr:glycoside hydrolase [Treponema sp.]
MEEKETARGEDFVDETAPVIDLPDPDKTLPVSSFGEIWAYVLAGRESALAAGMPLSDIGYFGAEIDSYGKLTDVPNPRRLRFFPARIHMVVTCNGRALSHFVLAHGSPERKALITDLVEAVKAFDGLQIDFELVPERDAGAFLSFLAELRTSLRDKIFTVALPARTRKINHDAFDYEKIKPLADRILVMAYDEHWSGGEPGPIASLPWCKNVADYALRVIGRDKLVMGIPFYGRAWGHINPSRAYIYPGIETIISENRISEIRRENGIPTFDYEVPVSVKVYYEDDYSLSVRMELYKSMGVASIGFWRLGQETPAIWNILRLETAVDRE